MKCEWIMHGSTGLRTNMALINSSPRPDHPTVHRLVKKQQPAVEAPWTHTVRISKRHKHNSAAVLTLTHASGVWHAPRQVCTSFSTLVCMSCQADLVTCAPAGAADSRPGIAYLMIQSVAYLMVSST
jgi:hypothetical protein